MRVEPTGESVIAARGAPNSEIVLLDNGTPVAKATADASGQVALLPPALKPGEHNLALSMKPTTGGAATSAQSVAVSVPAQPKTAPLVALIQPNQPAAILSGPVAGSAPSAKPASNTPSASTAPASVVIRSVEVETMGSFYATGKAAPGSLSRIYLNGASVAAVTADSKGAWSLKINRGMKPGHYAVRVDQVGADGNVVGRAEVPFDYPEQVASSIVRTDPAKKNTGDNGTAASGAASVASGLSAGGGERQAVGAPPSLLSGPKTAPDSPAGSASGIQPQPDRPAAGSDAGAPHTTGSPKRPSEQDNSVAANATKGAPSAPALTNGSAPPANPPTSSMDSSAAQPSTTAAPTKPTVPSAAPSSTQHREASDLANDDSADGATVVEELVTAKVIRGDSLWRISRTMLGHGVRYTQIYAANTQQIRDPKLIFPGQVFVMPQVQ